MSILIYILSILLGISTTVLLVIIVWFDTQEREDNSDEEADE